MVGYLDMEAALPVAMSYIPFGDTTVNWEEIWDLRAFLYIG
jgi:hypothetical protein